MKTVCAIAALALLGMVPAVHAADPLQAFPPAEIGMVRHVLHLPRQTDEAALKVELIVGKTVAVDQRNRYFFSGTIRKDDVPGWGYARYVVDRLGPMAGTRMAVDPNAPAVDRFVGLGGEPYLVGYNSRLPLVVYVPEGAEVRYRIWKGTGEPRPLPEG